MKWISRTQERRDGDAGGARGPAARRVPVARPAATRAHCRLPRRAATRCTRACCRPPRRPPSLRSAPPSRGRAPVYSMRNLNCIIVYGILYSNLHEQIPARGVRAGAGGAGALRGAGGPPRAPHALAGHAAAYAVQVHWPLDAELHLLYCDWYVF